MKIPVKEGEFYEDCTGYIAKAIEVHPRILDWKQWIWYLLTGHARNWDILGDYLDHPEPGRISNCSWRHCGCIRKDP